MAAKEMPPADRISGLAKIGEFRLARWTNRRQIEWKTSASVWAFLAALSSGIALEKITPPLGALTIFLAAVILIHFWWVYQNWIRNREDIKAAFDYFEQIHELASKRPKLERKRQEPRCIFQDAVPTSEVAISVMLSAVAFYLVYAIH
jgi:hypothetical protein